MVFWAFPSASVVQIKNQHAARLKEKQDLESKISTAQDELDLVAKANEASVCLERAPFWIK